MHNTFSPLLLTSIFELHKQTQAIILLVFNKLCLSHSGRNTGWEFSILGAVEDIRP